MKVITHLEAGDTVEETVRDSFPGHSVLIAACKNEPVLFKVMLTPVVADDMQRFLQRTKSVGKVKLDVHFPPTNIGNSHVIVMWKQKYSPSSLRIIEHLENSDEHSFPKPEQTGKVKVRVTNKVLDEMYDFLTKNDTITFKPKLLFNGRIPRHALGDVYRWRKKYGHVSLYLKNRDEKLYKIALELHNKGHPVFKYDKTLAFLAVKSYRETEFAKEAYLRMQSTNPQLWTYQWLGGYRSRPPNPSLDIAKIFAERYRKHLPRVHTFKEIRSCLERCDTLNIKTVERSFGTPCTVAGFSG